MDEFLREGRQKQIACRRLRRGKRWEFSPYFQPFAFRSLWGVAKELPRMRICYSLAWEDS